MKQDYREAISWFRRAADQGNAAAQNELGVIYDLGRGVPRNDAEAVRWYQLAANQNLAAAQVNLGAKYDAGHGVRQSYREAVKWFRLAANQGNASAQNNLGVMYADGLGVSVSRIAAYALYDVSAANDQSANNRASGNRNAIISKMTSAEYAAAQVLARELAQSTQLLKTLDQWCEQHDVKVL